MNGLTISATARRVSLAIWLASAAVLSLGILHAVLVAFAGQDPNDHLLRFLNLDNEDALPTWYSSVLLSVLAFLALLAALPSGREEPGRRAWYWIALILLAMSFDESASFHERTSRILVNLGLSPEMFGFGHEVFLWLLIGVPFATLVAAVLGPLLLRGDPRTALGVIAAGAVYVGGAVLLEIVGARLWTEASQGTGAYAAIVAVEEALELAGLSLMATVLLGHLARRSSLLVWRIAPGPAAAAPIAAVISPPETRPGSPPAPPR